ncbi:ABC transporter ATP-binding protein [Pseudoduganella umbonata]|uniref:ABC transporter ATP-binding protein n=1 Tax=Pseudoduganella umbonata TaxID=864828 RepID=A0A4P8HLQ8_9BURK|nr:ABC transporter ATP-binding protein [Pseudoduganella umbonata]MBB3221505.1 sulfonate transport system ATP-binding protein [Pseudoduganella umbonata]QCP10653.1 ABC transporter ATP-binding protein [Pseudoduganella umbonata]
MSVTASAPLLDILVARKAFGARTVLRDFRLHLAGGEFVSLIGASGSGKSSLLSIVAGLDRDWDGRVALAGQPLAGVSADIGVIFQEPRLFPWLTVAQNVAFGGDGDPAPLLAEVGLAGLGGYLPRQLSGGQAQRAAIARGLFSRPRVLLLDEPFSAVDAFTRIRLQDLLQRVAREHALTILMVTHDLDEALFLSDRIVLLDGAGGGRCAEYVPPAGPRRRDDPARAALKGTILDALYASHAL